MEIIHNSISSLGAFAPYACIVLFLLASLLVVWRLETLSGQGVEGTVLGTLFMPFCSGMGNMVFAFVPCSMVIFGGGSESPHRFPCAKSGVARWLPPHSRILFV